MDAEELLKKMDEHNQNSKTLAKFEGIKSKREFEKADMKDLFEAFIILQSNVQALNNTCAVKLQEIETKLSALEELQQKTLLNIQAVPVQSETLLLNHITETLSELDQNKIEIASMINNGTCKISEIMDSREHKIKNSLNFLHKEVTIRMSELQEKMLEITKNTKVVSDAYWKILYILMVVILLAVSIDFLRNYFGFGS